MNYEREYDRFLNCPEDEEIVLGECEDCGDEILISESFYKNRLDNTFVHEECMNRFIRTELGFDLYSEYEYDSEV